MLFTLEPLHASEGDCLLLHWGTKTKPFLAVIDGGPGQTYEDHLRPRLEEIATNRDLDQLPIEFVMVSHVDNDHVVGVKKLFRDLKEEQQKNLPAEERILEVKRLWHNTFNDVLNDSIDTYYNKLTATYTASVGGNENPQLTKKLEEAAIKRKTASKAEAPELARDVAKLLAGHGEGRTLRSDHQFLFDNNQIAVLNHPFASVGGKATLITAEKTPTAKTIEKLSIKVIGPLEAEIEALQKAFDKYIKDKKLTVEAVLAAYADPSVTNLSSIVCLISLGTKKILFTGDARGDKIIAGLKKAKLLSANKPLHLDVLKVPHHGSENNAAEDFFETITADHYVFSANGKHANPDRATLEWLVASRKKTDKFHIHLTYPIKEIDKKRKAHYDQHGQKWTAKKDSLASFFADHKTHAFTVHEESGPIDLGDETIDW